MPSSLPQEQAGHQLLQLAIQLLEPSEVTPALLQRTLKRARRHRLYWTILNEIERAILTAAAQARVTRYKNPQIKKLLATLIARVEAHTNKGRILITGLTHALTRKLASLTQNLRRKLDYLLYLGRNILTTQQYFQPLIPT